MRLVDSKTWMYNREMDLSAITYEKQGMSYIPWADLEAVVRERHDDLEFEAWPLEGRDSVGVRIVRDNGDSHQASQVYSLAITDFKNKPVAEPSCADIEDTIQRAWVKAVARELGFGHKLYEKAFHSNKPKVASKPKPAYAGATEGDII